MNRHQKQFLDDMIKIEIGQLRDLLAQESVWPREFIARKRARIEMAWRLRQVLRYLG